MIKLYLDIETYSSVDLKAVGVYRYVESPDFSIDLCSYAFDDDPVKTLEDEDIWQLQPYIEDPSILKVAHNAAFERICFSTFFDYKGYMDPAMFHDTMAVAGVRGYPKSLKPLAKALGAEEKDEAGTALVNFFSKPDRKGQRRFPEDHQEKWAAYVQYNAQDVATLRDVDRRMGDFPVEAERQVYLADQRINDRGMRVDTTLAARAVHVASWNQAQQVAEIQKITGIDNPNSNPQMTEWLRPRVPSLPNLRAETVQALLSGPLPDDVRRVLELRQELALIASKKFQAALNGVCGDGRIRGQFRYFGAHTGRWTGRGVQPQNLPRERFGTEVEAEAAILDLALGFGADAITLKKLVRPMFLGPFSVVDYSAIEARVIAWLAGEDWALKAFYEGRDIYVETAARMSTPDNQLNRSQGKVAVLALGYNGGVNSLRAMGASGTDNELKALVHQWRRANRNIVSLWSDLEEAFYRGGEAGMLRVRGNDRERHLELPSGRSIVYHGVRFRVENNGRRASFQSPQGFRTDTYGGRLSENATQAVARDVLAAALVRLDKAGYRVVGHIHDEILVETKDLNAVQEIMTEVPDWAEGLPIDGAGFVCRRYKKD